MLDTLGNLGDFVGGIGVLITLLYLAFQMRENTRALNTASRQDVADGYLRNVQGLFADPVAARAFSRGLSSYPDLAFEERSLFNTMMGAQSTFFQTVFALHESGNLPEDTYAAYRDWMACLVATPGGTAWWEAGIETLPANVAREIRERANCGELFDPRLLDGYRLDE